MRRLISVLFVAVWMGALPADAFAGSPPLIESFLIEGRLADGNAASKQHLAAHPGDAEAQLGLATAEFLQAVERLGQGLYRHGALGSRSWLGRLLPIVRLPVPENPDPIATSADDVRALVQTFLDDLATAERSLDAIAVDDVILPLHMGQIHFDFNADGIASAEESGWQMFQTMMNGRRVSRGRGAADDDAGNAIAKAFVIQLDRGDAYWLQGYCHLLSAFGEAALAHDADAFFGVVGPYLFAKPAAPDLPAEMFAETSRGMNLPFDEVHIADTIAAVHETRFPLVAPERMEKSLHHLEAVLALSRKTWESIEAETDDTAEWIPNARQTGVLPGMAVTAEMISSWQDFLDEAEAILAGKKLVPHWRLRDGYGINVREVFLQPRDFDVVRWVQGAAAVPYVSQGPCTNRATWAAIQRSFRGQFLSFAVWFN